MANNTVYVEVKFAVDEGLNGSQERDLIEFIEGLGGYNVDVEEQ